MKVKIDTSTGFYRVQVEGEVKADKLQAVVNDGIAQGCLYRGVFAAGREITGAKRKLDESAPFDASKAEELNALCVKALTDVLNDPVITVTQYVPPEGKDTTLASAKEAALAAFGKHESAGDLEEWLAASYDYTGPTHGADGEYHPDALAPVLKKAQANARAALDAMRAEMKAKAAAGL